MNRSSPSFEKANVGSFAEQIVSPLTKNPHIRIALVAGELSGDMLGTGVIESLKEIYPSALFFGIGGEGMASAGLDVFAPMDALSVMGLTEVLCHLPRLLRLRRDFIAAVNQFKPDLFVGIDAPDFNLPIEKRLRSQGIKTVHLGCPTVWAWRQGRIKTIRKAVDLLLALFPFEPEFLAARGQKSLFIGHPLADRLEPAGDPSPSREILGLDPEQPVIGLLPGSRHGEVSRLLPHYLDAATRLNQDQPQWQFAIPAATDRLFSEISAEIQQRKLTEVVHVYAGQSRDIMRASDVLLMASGTATLEALILGRPMVVCYRMSWLSAQIIRRLINVPHFSLPNVLWGGELVPEVVQNDVNGRNLAAIVRDLHSDRAKLKQQMDGFNTLRPQLRRDASRQAAKAISELIHPVGESPQGSDLI